MSKKTIRRNSSAIDPRSHQTLRRSPRFFSSERIGKLSSLQPVDGKENVETHLGNLSKMSMESDIQSRHRFVDRKTPLRRSNRFLSREKAKSEVSSQKSAFCRELVKFHPGSPSITSKWKEAASFRKIRAAISEKSQRKLSGSKSDVVLEETRSGPRRSPRLASQTGMQVSEMPQGFPDGKPRRQSMRLLGVAAVSAENAKARIGNHKACDKVKHKNPLEVDCKVVATSRSMELVSVTARAANEWNKPEAITMPYPEIVPKKKCEPMSSHIRRSSPRLLAASTGVVKRGITLEMTGKGEEVAERLNANRVDLVLESRIKDDFVITKTDDLHKPKRRKMEEDNEVENRIEKVESEECRVKVAWTIEQEEALRKAYLMAKPSPHFWKKVSRMVPEKSAQECFDKIHASTLTPLSPQPRPRPRQTTLSPIAHFNLSANILPPLVSKIEAGKLRRCRTKKPAAQKAARHLLRKHRLADQTRPADHFSLLESSPINLAVNLLNNISNSPCLSQKPDGKKSSDNSKMFSRFKLLTSPVGPSPQVLKRIKNRALHDRYIDQLHHREARRVMHAKKSKFDDSGNSECLGKPEHGALKAARTALMSDAKAFINHFQHSLANPMDELDTDCSDDAGEDIEVSDLDE